MTDRTERITFAAIVLLFAAMIACLVTAAIRGEPLAEPGTTVVIIDGIPYFI